MNLQFGLAATLLLAIPTLAQSPRTTHFAAAAAPVHARAIVPIHTSVSHPVGLRSAANRNTNRSASPNVGGASSGVPSPVQELLNPSPGFGFDYEHLSAMNSDLDIKALIDPVTQLRIARAERHLRESQSEAGVYFIDGGGSYVAPAAPDETPATDEQPAPQPQPQIIIVQQAAPTQSTAPEPADSAESVTEAPLADEGFFTLVLRDGTEIDAAAFTRASDKIVYITPTGGRHTIAIAELDSDATLRVNQERGTSLQLPL